MTGGENQMKLSKKGNLGDIEKLVWSLVLVGIFLGIGLLLLNNFYNQLQLQANNATASAAVNQTITGIAGIPTWIPLIVLIVIAAIILGYVFLIRNAGGGGSI
jgi:hypothetical protein